MSVSVCLLDGCVGVLYELLGLAEQQDRLVAGQEAAEGAVMEVVREVRRGEGRGFTLGDWVGRVGVSD